MIEAIYLFSLQISPEGKQVKTDNGKRGGITRKCSLTCQQCGLQLSWDKKRLQKRAFGWGVKIANRLRRAYALRKDAKDAIPGRLSAGDYAPHPWGTPVTGPTLCVVQKSSRLFCPWPAMLCYRRMLPSLYVCEPSVVCISEPYKLQALSLRRLYKQKRHPY